MSDPFRPWAIGFTVVMVTFWVAGFVWSYKRRPFYAFALVIATLYCFLSEAAAIIQGMYFYKELVFGTISIPHDGRFATFATTIGQFVASASCPPQESRIVPVGVMAMEGVFLIAIMRTTGLLGVRWYARPFLNALVAVNLDMILDPIVSTSYNCSAPMPPLQGLSFWVWRLTEQDPNAFFGIPMMNFLAWYANVFAFVLAIGFVAQHFGIERKWGSGLADEALSATELPNAIATGPKGAQGGFWHDLWVAGLALVLFMIVEFVVLWLLKKGLYARPGVAWQTGFTVAILAASLMVVVVAWRPLRVDHGFEWMHALPQIFVFLFTVVALALTIYDDRPALWIVWSISTVLGTAFGLAPYRHSLVGRITGRPPATGA